MTEPYRLYRGWRIIGDQKGYFAWACGKWNGKHIYGKTLAETKRKITAHVKG